MIAAPFRRWLAQFPEMELHDRSNGTDRLALIVDDRDDEVTRRVYANVLAVCGDAWDSRWVRPSSSDGLPFSPDRFTKTLRTPGFWESLPEHVLVFQRDSVMFRPIPEALLTYPMVGACCGENGAVMNGGFSLRRSSVMASIAATEHGDDLPEDVFFSRQIQDRGLPMPTMYERMSFAVENDPIERLYDFVPCGVHGTDKAYLTDEQAALLVERALTLIEGGAPWTH